MTSKLVVHLRVISGKELTYSGTGKLLNENQVVKIEHNTFEWLNYLKQLAFHHFAKVSVEKVFEKVDGKYVESTNQELKAKIEKEVSAAYEKPAQELTPDQKKIKELEEKLERLLSQGDPKKEPKDDELESLRATYKSITGKSADKRWGIEALTEKIAELQK